MKRALRFNMSLIPHARGDLGTRLSGGSRLHGVVSLVFGGVVTIAASLFTLFHLNDHDIVRATVPGFLLGFGLFVAFIIRNRAEGARGYGRRRSV